MSERKEYEKIRKKYKKLPKWKWIEANFKIKTEEEWHVLEIIRYSIAEKLSIVGKIIIEPIVSGGRDYSSYLERRMFSKKELEELFKVYQEIQELGWKSASLKVDEFSEKSFVEWITEVKKEWDVLRPKAVKLCKKISKGWGEFKKPEQNTAYHG